MKYLRKFKSVADANAQGALGLYSPQLNNIEGKSDINSYKSSAETFTATFDNNGVMTPITPPPVLTSMTFTGTYNGTKAPGDGGVLNIETYSNDWKVMGYYSDGSSADISSLCSIANPSLPVHYLYEWSVNCTWKASLDGCSSSLTLWVTQKYK